ncbi:MAG: DUF72 domain-containing protein [Verrucomicrobiota bacterium]
MSFSKAALTPILAKLAEQKIYLGTSSWKYPGWIGQLYSEDRYLYRGKVAKTRFERHCLEEYAEVFKTVCVDAGYYRFPNEKYLAGLSHQVPEDFRFSFKVTDHITIKKFSKLPRFGDLAGKNNEHFLDAELFKKAFLRPCETIQSKVGVLIFEFSRFYSGQFDKGREFAGAMDTFLAKLPSDWQYGIEIRNESFLHPDYFSVLAAHNVAHVYNNWQKMPSVGEQLEIEGSRPANFTAARFLLTPGRNYNEAVDSFSPYNKTVQIDEEARSAGGKLIVSLTKSSAQQPSFIYLNNRLEGNALNSLHAMIEKSRILPR